MTAFFPTRKLCRRLLNSCKDLMKEVQLQCTRTTDLAAFTTHLIQAHSSKTFWCILRIQYRRLKMTYKQTIPDERMRFTHAALRVFQLTSTDNRSPITGSSTLARNASGSLHTEYTDLEKICKLFLYSI